MDKKHKILTLSFLAFLNCSSSVFGRGKKVQKTPEQANSINQYTYINNVPTNVMPRQITNVKKDQKTDYLIKAMEIIGGVLIAGAAFHPIAIKITNNFVFWGPNYNYTFDTKMYNYKLGSCKFHSDKLGVDLQGYRVQYDNRPIKKILIYFYGNAENSKKALNFFGCAPKNSESIIESNKDTLFICFDYPLKKYINNENHLSYDMMNEKESKIFAEEILDYVIRTYVEPAQGEKPKIAMAGFSLGTFFPTSVADRKEILSMYLRSPACLDQIVGGKPIAYYINGSTFNSIQNLIDAKRDGGPLRLILSSGGDYDMCSLKKSIPYTVGFHWWEYLDYPTLADALKPTLQSKLNNIIIDELHITDYDMNLSDWNHESSCFNSCLEKLN